MLEAPYRVMEAGFHGSLGHADLACHFLNPQAPVVSKDDDLPVLLRQFLKGKGDSAGIVVSIQIVRRLGLGRFLEDTLLGKDQAALFPEMAAAKVQENAMQPGIDS